MRRRQVAKGRTARERRYHAAVTRQLRAVRLGGPRYLYADPTEFLRRGDHLGRFLTATPAAATDR